MKGDAIERNVTKSTPKREITSEEMPHLEGKDDFEKGASEKIVSRNFSLCRVMCVLKKECSNGSCLLDCKLMKGGRK